MRLRPKNKVGRKRSSDDELPPPKPGDPDYVPRRGEPGWVPLVARPAFPPPFVDYNPDNPPAAFPTLKFGRPREPVGPARDSPSYRISPPPLVTGPRDSSSYRISPPPLDTSSYRISPPPLVKGPRVSRPRGTLRPHGLPMDATLIHQRHPKILFDIPRGATLPGRATRSGRTTPYSDVRSRPDAASTTQVPTRDECNTPTRDECDTSPNKQLQREIASRSGGQKASDGVDGQAARRRVRFAVNDGSVSGTRQDPVDLDHEPSGQAAARHDAGGLMILDVSHHETPLQRELARCFPGEKTPETYLQFVSRMSAELDDFYLGDRHISGILKYSARPSRTLPKTKMQAGTSASFEESMNPDTIPPAWDATPDSRAEQRDQGLHRFFGHTDPHKNHMDFRPRTEDRTSSSWRPSPDPHATTAPDPPPGPDLGYSFDMFESYRRGFRPDNTRLCELLERYNRPQRLLDITKGKYAHWGRTRAQKHQWTCHELDISHREHLKKQIEDEMATSAEEGPARPSKRGVTGREKSRQRRPEEQAEMATSAEEGPARPSKGGVKGLEKSRQRQPEKQGEIEMEKSKGAAPDAPSSVSGRWNLPSEEDYELMLEASKIGQVEWHPGAPMREGRDGAGMGEGVFILGPAPGGGLSWEDRG